MPRSKQIDKPVETGYVDKRKKTLINLGEQRKDWVKRVVDLAVQAGSETNQTEIINVLVDQAMIEDPESFIVRLGKLKLRARIADIERRESALQAEKEKLAAEVEHVERGMAHAANK